MQKASILIAVVSLAMTVLMGAVDVAQWAGVEFEDAMAKIASVTGAILPIMAFIAGLSIGLSIRIPKLSRRIEEKNAEIERMKNASDAKDAEIARLKAEIKQENENSRIRKEARTLDGRLTVGMDGLAAFTRPMALAALDAADNGYVATADHPCVVDSIARGDGVFDYRGYYFGGARVRSDESAYRITHGWYEFLNERAARDALKDIASGKR